MPVIIGPTSMSPAAIECSESGELARVVTEDELDVDLFGDRVERVHGVGLHADAGHHQPDARRCPTQYVVDDPGRADRLEHHRRLALVER